RRCGWRRADSRRSGARARPGRKGCAPAAGSARAAPSSDREGAGAVAPAPARHAARTNAGREPVGAAPWPNLGTLAGAVQPAPAPGSVGQRVDLDNRVSSIYERSAVAREAGEELHTDLNDVRRNRSTHGERTRRRIFRFWEWRFDYGKALSRSRAIWR